MTKKIFIFSTLILVAFIALGSLSSVQSENETEIQKAVNYLSSQSQTPWITMALAAAGEANIDLEHLESIPAGQASVTSYAKNILALTAVGKDPTAFGSENYVEQLKGLYDSQSKQFGSEDLINDDIWAVLALGALGQENLSIAQDAKDFILAHQNVDGGWGYAPSADSDSNVTAAALMALLEAGVSPEFSQIEEAVVYLKSIQNDDGGFPWTSGRVSDSASDAWIISAIYKLGQDPASQDWTKGANNPVLHLKSLQDDDGGFWWQAEGDNKMDTPWAVIALSGQYYPVYTVYNKHFLRIEGEEAAIWSGFVYGASPLDLIINASKPGGFNYQIIEYPFGLYLRGLNSEVDSWMYMVNNVSGQVGAGDYFLSKDDEVLLYFGQWLDAGWTPTKIELTKTESLVNIQVKYYETTGAGWQDLAVQGIKVKVGESEFLSNALGQVELSLAGLGQGFYQVFAESQVIGGAGYIRSEKVSLKTGEAPDGHKTDLVVEIEQVEPSPAGQQSVISFSTSPGILDFGKLKPGEGSSQNFYVSNGTGRIHLEVEVTGADVFQNNLEIDQEFWQNFSAGLTEEQDAAFLVGLKIPSSYAGDFGEQRGEIIFWAIKE